MIFLPNGPDVPEALIDAHEDGKVVLFCGAGISQPTMPGFKGLVSAVYERLGTSLSSIEQRAFNEGNYDAALQQLQRRLPGGGPKLRECVAEILDSSSVGPTATKTHAALTTLATNRNGYLRLVTTNFDHLFEEAAKRDAKSLPIQTAPYLPVPKQSRWNCLVHLHGRIPDRSDQTELNRLVLTSGDFGHAYLTERWASRFVGELFRSYTVCFVGYSLNDPVMRYMMDALAADRDLGEHSQTAFAFGECERGCEEHKAEEWKAKGVEPILYTLLGNETDHTNLHQTLARWAAIYRDGVRGKKSVVLEHALANPAASTTQDDFVGRMLWALSDQSGEPAKSFANFEPAPPLTWLQPLLDRRYGERDLPRFGLDAYRKDGDLRFSLLERPAPHSHAAWMSLTRRGDSSASLDKITFQLGRWLTRHLNDPDLILWVAERGGDLNYSFRRLLATRLEEIDQFVAGANRRAIGAEESKAQSSIPSPAMRLIWSMVLGGHLKAPFHEADLPGWIERFNREGLNVASRLELREILRPKLAISKPYTQSRSVDPNEEKPSDLFNLSLELAATYAHSHLELLDEEKWLEESAALVPDLEQGLLDALQLGQFVGLDRYTEPSVEDMPSIAPHWQNRKDHDWTVLIELLRDGWLSMYDRDMSAAVAQVKGWMSNDFVVFRRLSLFAATKSGDIAGLVLQAMLDNSSHFSVWEQNSKREVLRFFATCSSRYDGALSDDIQKLILHGPPRPDYVDVSLEQEWLDQRDYSVWLRLAKIQEGGAELSSAAKFRFAELSKQHPDWTTANDESDEFCCWMSGWGYPVFEQSKKINIAPPGREQLVEWLLEESCQDRPSDGNNWKEICTNQPQRAFRALWDCHRIGAWPIKPWQEAVQVWHSEEHYRRARRLVLPLLLEAPNEVLMELSKRISHWLRFLAETSPSYNEHIAALCARCIQFEFDGGVNNGEPVTEAINHPIGHFTEALLYQWFKMSPTDNEGLPDWISEPFTTLFESDKDQFKHGRVILSSRLIALYRIDDVWTRRHVIPRLNWAADPEEAKRLWVGFLWSPRLYRPLFSEIKTSFLETARHVVELGKSDRQFVSVLTYAALDPDADITLNDYQNAFAELPVEALENAAFTLLQSLEGAGDQREENWKNRVRPFWHSIWPKDKNLNSDRIAVTCARICIAAGREFPDAVSTLINWVQPNGDVHIGILKLADSGLARDFPSEALSLLDALVRKEPISPQGVVSALQEIRTGAPQLAKDRRFIRLSDYFPDEFSSDPNIP